MKNNQIQCKSCKNLKSQNEFYLIDGGLGIEGVENLRFEICKECVSIYNTQNKSTTRLKYLKWQLVACYLGAKEYITRRNGINDKEILRHITSQISNGYKSYNQGSTSLEMAIQNFIYLFDGVDRLGLAGGAGKSRIEVYKSLEGSQNINETINQILRNDYVISQRYINTLKNI
ncbi:hypothetical protein [Helicobacter sp. T3_23-1056]